MTLIRHAGKFIAQLPTAIEQVLRVVQFTALAPTTGESCGHPTMDDHQAEYEENESPEVEQQEPPASGTPPGTPPPWNPRKTASDGRIGRVQEAVQRIEGPPIVSVPTPKWHGWKTQTGPTIADVEQSRMSPFGEPELETADAELREAMARSLQEIRHDPNELPNTGGASGSGGVTQHVPSPQQASTPNTQSEGEGSVIPKGQSRIALTPLRLPAGQVTPTDLSLALEERIRKHRERINELIQRMSSFDQEATEADMIELNELKQSIASCQRTLDQVNQGVQVEAIPRPPVQLPRFSSPAPAEDEPMDHRSSRSRPRPHVRGRSKSEKGDIPIQGIVDHLEGEKAIQWWLCLKLPYHHQRWLQYFRVEMRNLLHHVQPLKNQLCLFHFSFRQLGQTIPPPSTIVGQPGPPGDPRSQSERRRRVSIQTPPTADEVPLGQIPVPFAGRQLPPRSTSAEPKAPSVDYSVLQSRQDPHQQGRSTLYGR